MDPDQLLESLGLCVGLPQLRFDGNGCARVSVDGAPALNFEREGEVIHVYSVIGALPAAGREALYAKLLQGNLFGASTAGASLSIDEVHEEVVLCRAFAAESSGADDFATAVEALVATSEDWRSRLSNAGRLDASTSEPSMHARFMDHFLRG